MKETRPDRSTSALMPRALVIGGALALVGLMAASPSSHPGPPPVVVIHGECFEQAEDRIFVRYWSDGTIDYTVTENPLQGPPLVFRNEVVAAGPRPTAPARRLPRQSSTGR